MSLKIWKYAQALPRMSFSRCWPALLCAVAAGICAKPISGWWLQLEKNRKLISHIKPKGHFAKPRPAVFAALRPSVATPMYAGHPLELEALVGADYDLDNVVVEWELPPDCPLLQGSKVQTISHVSANQTQSVFITVVLPATDENIQFNVAVNFLKGDVKLGNTAQFNTREDLLSSDKTNGSNLMKVMEAPGPERVPANVKIQQ